MIRTISRTHLRAALREAQEAVGWPDDHWLCFALEGVADAPRVAIGDYWLDGCGCPLVQAGLVGRDGQTNGSISALDRQTYANAFDRAVERHNIAWWPVALAVSDA